MGKKEKFGYDINYLRWFRSTPEGKLGKKNVLWNVALRHFGACAWNAAIRTGVITEPHICSDCNWGPRSLSARYCRSGILMNGKKRICKYKYGASCANT